MDLNILLEWFKHYNYVCIPILAFIIDTIIGDPNSKFHPVALIGRVNNKCQNWNTHIVVVNLGVGKFHNASNYRHAVVGG